MDAVQIPGVVAQMESWISHRCRSHFITVANVHVLMEARYGLSFRKVLDYADLCVPDGMPLVWLGRWHGYAMRRRDYGPSSAVLQGPSTDIISTGGGCYRV